MLNGSGEEQQGSREEAAESSERWEVKLSSYPQGQGDKAAARTALTALYLDLLSCQPGLQLHTGRGGN